MGRRLDEHEALLQRIEAAIRDATGAEGDLRASAIAIRRASREPLWPHPVFPRKDADDLKRAVRDLRHKVADFNRAWMQRPPYALSDKHAASDVVKALDRFAPVVDEICELAARRRAEYEEFEGKKLTKGRKWPAYNLALAAVITLEELTNELPEYSKSKRVPLRRLIQSLYSIFDIKIKDIEEPIKWALMPD